MTRRPFIFLLGFLTATLIICGCSSEGCLNNQNALPLADFYSGGKKVSLRGIEIRGVGAPGDSILVPATQAVSTVYLPMRSDRPSTEWELRFNPSTSLSISDFITFHYTSEPHFASEECGAMYFYRINRVDYTTNMIDSVVVIDSLITNYDLTRIHIYLHEEEAQEEPEE